MAARLGDTNGAGSSSAPTRGWGTFDAWSCATTAPSMLKNSARERSPRPSSRELNHEMAFRFPQRSLHWSLFRKRIACMISVNGLGSDMLARTYPRGTAGRAVSVAPKKLARTLILILGTLGFNFACQGCHSQKSSAGPSIEFTHFPPAAQGGRERVDTISGPVRYARPKRHIVIYAYSGPWWVQPWLPYLGA
jgi:hypothetical protein